MKKKATSVTVEASSYPFGITVSNRSKKAIQNVELFNPQKNIRSRWFTEDGYFLVNGLYDGVSIQGVYAHYAEMLAAFLSEKIMVGSTLIYITGYDEATTKKIKSGSIKEIVLMVNTNAFNGFGSGCPVVVKLDEAQLQKDTLLNNTPYRIDVSTSIVIKEIPALTAFQFYFYPEQNITSRIVAKKPTNKVAKKRAVSKPVSKKAAVKKAIKK